MNSKRLRSAAIYVLLLVALGAFLYTSLARRPENAATTVPIARIAELVRAGSISSIKIKDDRISAVNRNTGEALTSRKEAGIGLVETLTNLGVEAKQLENVDIAVESPAMWESWGGILLALLPLLLLGVFFYFIMRQAQGAGNQAFSFGKSRARMFTGDRPTVTFGDVAGNDEAKQELTEVVEFLKEPEKFAALGARIPKGVLLVGPPGTGKTLMAKAVSGEAGVPFFSISGSEFVEMFVGVGASRVRDLFEQAKRNSPCIIFIDEIDAVGRYRGTGLGGSHDEREQTLNQILVEMDGFGTDTNVILIAATNRPDILDPALLRPGRFDRRVTMDRPDVRGRFEILKVHVRGKPVAPDVDLENVAKQTPGFVGADLENVVNEAAILAARRNKRAISMSELQEAVERIGMGGPERRSRLMTERDKRITAYHEAGHALVARMCANADPIQKITIVPRSNAAGYVWQISDHDRVLVSRGYYLDRIAVALGGRVAEEVIFGEVTTGASNDIQTLTSIARAMVTKYGMSESMGPLQFGQQDEMVFLGRELAEQRNYSEEVAEQIDAEVRRIVDAAYVRVHQLLTANTEKLHAIARALLDRETLDTSEFEEVFLAAA